MADADIETELMISLIQDRPALWDKSSPLFKDRNAKRNGWEEVCALLNDELQGMEEKQKSQFEKEVIKKWNNVRDYYAKSCKSIKANKRSGAKGKLPKKYIFNDQLSFLKKNYESRPTAESWENAERSDDENYNDDCANETDAAGSDSPPSMTAPKNPLPLAKTSRKRRHNEEFEMRMLKVLEEDQPNRHLSFFKGVIPSLEGFDENEILQFQFGVLETITKIRREKQNNTASSSYNNACYSQPPAWQPNLLSAIGSNHPSSYYSQPLSYSSENVPQSTPTRPTSTVRNSGQSHYYNSSHHVQKINSQQSFENNKTDSSSDS